MDNKHVLGLALKLWLGGVRVVRAIHDESSRNFSRSELGHQAHYHLKKAPTARNAFRWTKGGRFRAYQQLPSILTRVAHGLTRGTSPPCRLDRPALAALRCCARNPNSQTQPACMSWTSRHNGMLGHGLVICRVYVSLAGRAGG